MGSRVTAIHPITRSLAEGVVLTAGATVTGAAARLAQLGVGGAFGAALGASSLGSFGAGSRCRVQFDREELGVHPVRDVDVALVPPERQRWPEVSVLAGVFVPGLPPSPKVAAAEAAANDDVSDATDFEEDDDETETDVEEEEEEELDPSLVEEAWAKAWAEAAARVRAVAKEALEEEEGQRPSSAAALKQRKSKRRSSAGAVAPPAPPPAAADSLPSPLSPGEAERLAALVTKCSAVLSAMQGAAEAVAAASSASAGDGGGGGGSSAPLTKKRATSSTTTAAATPPSVATAVAAFDRAVHVLCDNYSAGLLPLAPSSEKSDDDNNREVYGRCAGLLAQARALIRPPAGRALRK